MEWKSEVQESGSKIGRGRDSWLPDRRRAIMSIAVILLLAALARGYSPYWPGMVIGKSMLPTLKPFHLFIIDRDYYRSHKLEKGDVIVFKWAGETLVKRVAALPGERIWVLADKSRWRGNRIEEIVKPRDLPKYRRALQTAFGKVYRLRCTKIPAKSVFVTGDNSNYSFDSRQMGPVDVQSIVGKVEHPG